MDNNLLKYMAFVKTVETGSFTKAAESLHYAQSSVSKMIANLEKEWNLVLLEWNRDGDDTDRHFFQCGDPLVPQYFCGVSERFPGD